MYILQLSLNLCANNFFSELNYPFTLKIFHLSLSSSNGFACYKPIICAKKYFFFLLSTLDLDPCNNAGCKHYSDCEASSPQQFSCVCESSCPSYEEQVCATNGRTFRNMCLLKKEICETRGNYTHYQPGSCTGI